MRLLITGGAGFIGSRAAKKFVKQGHQVIIMSRNPKIEDPDLVSKVKVVSGDLRDFSDVMRIVAENKPDTIIHTAYALTAAGEANPHWAIQVNVLGTNNIYESARLYGVKRVIFGSSIAAYGPLQMYGERVVKEDDLLPKAPTIYGATKALNEFMAAKFEALYGVEIPSLRISAVYGTGRAARGLTAWTSQMIRAAVRNEKAKFPIQPGQKTSFIYVDDIAEQLVRLALKEKLDYRIYNSGGTISTPQEFAAIVRKYYPKMEIEFDEHVNIWPFPFNLDGSRLEKEIEFKIRTPEEGLLEQINLEKEAFGLV